MPDDSTFDLQDLLDGLGTRADEEFKSTPQVEDASYPLDVTTIPIVARKWIKLDDVVAVVADLKNSTKLGTGKRASSTASIYEATTGGVVDIYDRFNADFIQIQGDGAFALFWGELRYERAACAGITVKTFSRDVADKIAKKWPSTPETGFKVGIGSGRALVKRIGTPRNPAQQEPVWAGKPVNYAAKAAQGADRHEMVVTGSVWDQFERNDHLAFSCPCGDGPSLGIWENTEIDRLPDDDPEAQGRLLKAGWCTVHGADYCDKILQGQRKRDDVEDLRDALALSQMGIAVRKTAARKRLEVRNRRFGLSQR